MASSPVRLLRIPVIVWMLIGSAGCGLSDYERRMDEQRKRVKDFDETNKLLDDPIETPLLQFPTGVTKPDGKPEMRAEAAWPFEIYLRLPKGFGSKVPEKGPNPFGQFSFPCFRYSGPDQARNFLVVATNIAESDRLEKREYTAKTFRVKVQQALSDFLLKTYNINYLLDKLPTRKVAVKEFSPLTPPPDDDKKITYEMIAFAGAKYPSTKEPMVFQAYFHELPPRQVCIIAHHPQQMKDAEAFNKSLEACLGTLDIGLEATARRNYFLKAKR